MKYNLTRGYNDSNAHRRHFSYPIKSCKYLKEARVEACPAFFLFFDITVFAVVPAFKPFLFTSF